jgi:hypothetical protein
MYLRDPRDAFPASDDPSGQRDPNRDARCQQPARGNAEPDTDISRSELVGQGCGHRDTEWGLRRNGLDCDGGRARGELACRLPARAGCSAFLEDQLLGLRQRASCRNARGEYLSSAVGHADLPDPFR